MTVKVTLEFGNIDQAIVALGKLVAAKIEKSAQGPTNAALASELGVPVVAQPDPVKQRRGRSDKGKPRKNNVPEAPAAGGTDQPAATPPAVQEAAAPVPGEADKAQPTGATPEAAAPTATAAEAQKALETLFETPAPVGGIDAARGVLASFGVARVRDLPDEKRAGFIAEVAKRLAGAA